MLRCVTLKRTRLKLRRNSTVHLLCNLGVLSNLTFLTLYSEDESDSDEEDQNDKYTRWGTQKKQKNSALAVGYKGINVVVRGDQIGVFRETEDGKLRLGGTVSDIKTPGPKGTQFEPSKVRRPKVHPSVPKLRPIGHAPRPRPVPGAHESE